MRALRIGVVNLMPRAETYERLLRASLAATERPSTLTWLRLTTPAYASSDRSRIERDYEPLSAALQAGRLDGLIVSGAPVDELPFDAVTYWSELSGLLIEARQRVRSTLGLCWGALALAKLLGIEKVTFERKLFGVYTLDRLTDDDALSRELPPQFACPQSRFAGLAEDSLRASVERGSVRVLAGSAEAGPVVVASADERYLMHVGHPEYDADRLLYEYERDRAAISDRVGAPHGFDLEHPSATWAGASTSFFRAWIDSL